MSDPHAHDHGSDHEQDTAEDFSLAYLDSHDGLTLLLIHGFPLSGGMWEGQIVELRDELRIIAPDLRGHGHSDAPDPPYTIAEFADDLAGLMDHLSIHGPFIVCGLSMGGYIAFEFYRRYREHVAGLVLMATRAGADSEEGQANRDKAVAAVRAEGVTAVIESMLPKLFSPQTSEHQPELVAALKELMVMTSEDGMIGALEAMKTRVDSTALLAEIDVPTLVIHGSDDQIVPPPEAKAMADAIPEAELLLVEDAGHLPNIEQPDIVNEALFDFIYDVRATLGEGEGY